MRRSLIYVGLVVLAGCGAEHRAENGASADINAAAQAAQGDIDTYAATTLESVAAQPQKVKAEAAPPTSRAPSAPPPAPPVAVADADADVAVGPAGGDANYRCAGETRISVRFDGEAGTATVRQSGRDVAVLEGQHPATGIWYKSGGYELRGGDGSADYTAPGHQPVGCTAD